MEDDLFEKIYQLDATELRQIVLGLCLDPKNKEAVAKHIKLLPKEGAAKPAQPQSSKPTTIPAEPAPAAQSQNPEGTERPTSRRSSVHTTPYTRRKCENCDFWFTAIDNAEKACKFHPGDMIIDPGTNVWSTLWDGSVPSDWDNEHGRQMFPRGFRWTCCGGIGPNCFPCVEQYHVSRPKDTYAV
ncbi:hypothetical protein PG996_012349 [Apiospora saccharicola]|uniref:Uncharacterized protein n=1 Tax=Apiospora saccharicola TaxID=335842 RepID=A0ABR1U2K5_9PEZI